MKFLLFLAIFVALTFTVSAQTVEVAFAAHGQDPSAETLVLKVINSAKREICVAAYNFTDREIIQALLEAVSRGVDVKVVHDAVASKEKGDGTMAILTGGGQVQLDRNYKIMHDKFIVVDGETVETGSFNYSRSAHQENAENVLVLWNFPTVATTYLNEWARLWSESAPPR